MTATEILAIHARYEAAFGNLEEMARPGGLLADPKFIALLEAAMSRGTAVTEREVKVAFPAADWGALVLDDEADVLQLKAAIEADIQAGRTHPGQG
jgi:hypothetical protein